MCIRDRYYVVGFADKYGEVGLGPERADVMVRAGSVVERGVPLSFHSDLPMGPADPLAMASFAVNRITTSGRVAGPEQRISVQAALEAVTIGAAHSWRRDHELGSIEPGKIANFTVLADDPFEVDPTDLASIEVEGNVFEGRWFPVPDAHRARRTAAASVGRHSTGLRAPGSSGHADPCGHGCACDVAEFVSRQVAG